MTVAETFGDVVNMQAQMASAKIVELKAAKEMSEEVERLVALEKKEI